ILAAALPPVKSPRGKIAAGGRALESPATETIYSLAVPPEEALRASARAPRQRQVIEALAAAAGPMSVIELREALGDVGAALSGLRRRGSVRPGRRAGTRAPGLLDPVPLAVPPIPTPEQAAAVTAVASGIERATYTGFLLVGPTGSGKTEVYLRSIEAALGAGRSAIYLVPEISLTPLLARTLRARFGAAFALLHSSLTPGERATEWRRARSGEARVALGPRSALLSPLGAVGLIVVDEEQDSSFKQESDPRYNARDLALVRAQKEGACALLGSATPSMESYRLAETGRLTLLTLTERIEARPLPAVELVDMRIEDEAIGGDEPLSRRVREALRERLARGEQSIVFLNRRGWAPSVLCRKCGENLKCRRCSIALTWHRADRRLLCHYCGYQRGLPDACPSCGSDRLTLAGTGTEKLYDEIRQIFPEARVARLDRDVARGRGEPGRILEAFERGAHDILVGTQLVAKGHDFPNVTFVGVVSADFSLGFPDFRAAERTFQVLTQVAGRAGRGGRPGEVVIQAYRPDHYAIQAAARQDFAGFYQKESRYRKLMGYPPFTAMANVVASAASITTAQRRAAEAAAAIRRAGGDDLRVTGPAIAPLAKLKNRYRFQIMVRAADRRRLSMALNHAVEEMSKSAAGMRDLVVDVDPASLL
ncbi:MAG TPA: primosomal protein N', partial [Verrucomicrobiae bacterium]|nr:primosomal protein N' [Verrucomicrobiae bacterium]